MAENTELFSQEWIDTLVDALTGLVMQHLEDEGGAPSID